MRPSTRHCFCPASMAASTAAPAPGRMASPIPTARTTRRIPRAIRVRCTRRSRTSMTPPPIRTTTATRSSRFTARRSSAPMTPIPVRQATDRACRTLGVCTASSISPVRRKPPATSPRISPRPRTIPRTRPGGSSPFRKRDVRISPMNSRTRSTAWTRCSTASRSKPASEPTALRVSCGPRQIAISPRTSPEHTPGGRTTSLTCPSQNAPSTSAIRATPPTPT